MRKTVIASCVAMALLASCASAPKPPVPDESNKRPANDPRDLSVMECRAQLASVRLEVQDALALAENATARLAADRTASARAQPVALPAPSKVRAPSRIFVVFYKFGATTFEMDEGERARLLEAARDAEYVQVRGRTDGDVETPGESRVARLRAESMQMFLIANGVAPDKVVANWQPIGDHWVPNTSAEGRAMNRRVEIETYWVRPERSQAADTHVLSAGRAS